MRKMKCLSVLLALSLASVCMLPAMNGKAAGSGDAKPQTLSDDAGEWQEFLNDTSWWNRLSINGVGETSLISDPNGGTLQLEVTEQPYLNVVTDQVEWSIDKPGIASISDQGLVTAKKPGSVTVTARATLNGTAKSGQLEIDILDKDASYQDDFDDIAAQYQVPEWYRDAKFGIFVHWGVYSVPAYYSEWIPNAMYYDGAVRDEVVRRYGPLSEKGYKDFITQFRAENYDPGAWADLFQKAGAKYVVPVAEHHDGIPMYDTKWSRWNMANIGPKKDFIAPLAEAVRGRGMKLGLSNHFLENEQYYDGAKDTDDASDPRWFDLYNNAFQVTGSGNHFTYSGTHMQMWYNRSREMIDKFHPDLVYYDWTIDKNRYTEQLLSYYYNRAEDTNPGGVVVNYKHNLPDGCAVYDFERGQSDRIRPMAWQTCTSVSNLSWGYIENDSYKQPVNLISLLIDVVSKNGNLLLNVGPDKTGSIPADARDTFLSIGKWLETNGEGIYATRPWTVFGEGPTEVGGEKFAETNEFTSQDIRFTVSKDHKNLYVIGMKWPQSRTVQVQSLKQGEIDLDGLNGLSLLGSAGEIEWRQGEDGLSVTLPEDNPNGGDFPYVLKLEFDGTLPTQKNISSIKALKPVMEPDILKNKIVIRGEGLEDGIRIQASADGYPEETVNAVTSGDEIIQTANLEFPVNRTGKNLSYHVRMSLDEGKTWQDTEAEMIRYYSENLLTGAQLSNQGENWPGCGAEKAADADPATRWANMTDAESTWLEIDLGEKKTFNRFVMDEYVNLEDEEDLHRGRITGYTIQYWDGAKWTECFDSAAAKGYEVKYPDSDAWEFDGENNLYRDRNGNIIKTVHTAVFDAVASEKLRIQFKMKKEVSLFEIRLENTEDGPKEDVAQKFADVEAGSWFVDEIQDIYDRGIMQGLDDVYFGPDVKLSRAQFATMLYRMENLPPVAYRDRFRDVPDNDGLFYKDAVIWASGDEVGVITGYKKEDGTPTGFFGPADFITREQMAAMLYRYAVYKQDHKYNTDLQSEIPDFPDWSAVSEFAEEAMEWAAEKGVITGDAGRLNPQGLTSRAVCATIIQRFLKIEPAEANVSVDFSKPQGTPLVKKFGMFQSGLVPMERTERDFPLLKALGPESVRLELGFGAPGWIMSDAITGTADNPRFSYEQMDRYADLVREAGGLPYWAYGYNPYPLQSDNNYRSQPSDLEKWKEYLRDISAHFREEGVRIGYQEVWNEPDCFDLFYTGTWEDYCELYKYGAAGILEGNPDAVIGGPSTAWVMDPGTRYADFLNYVKGNRLPLDFFSMHSYGSDYMNRLRVVRQALQAAGEDFSTTSVHVNEINSVLNPWNYGGDCDHYGIAADIFRILSDLTEQNDVETVSWAQFLESGVDALGVVDEKGRKKASYNAFEIWARMPVDRYPLKSGSVRGLASADDCRAGVVLWNESEEAQEITAVMDALPFDRGSVEIYRIDEAHCSYGDGAGEELIPTESYTDRAIGSFTWSSEIPAGGVVYIEANDGLGHQEPDQSGPDKARIQRQYHYYYSRGASNYAYFDEKTWTARLGMGDVEWTDSIVGVLADHLPDELNIAFDVCGELQEKDRNSLLGMRIDFETDGGYENSVQFHGGLYRGDRDFLQRWGTKKLPDQVVEKDLSGFTVKLSDYAPENWTGRAILTFEMQNSGVGTSAKATVR